MSAPISRTQAWCKLAILIAEGLPAPEVIHIQADRVGVTVSEHADFLAWATRFGADVAREGKPFIATSGWHLYSALVDDWFGRALALDLHLPPPDLTEDMSRVREVAEEVTE